MSMRKLLGILLLVAWAVAPATALTTNSVIIARITITNYANITGTNAERIWISNDWGATSRTWTNAVYSASTQIKAGTSIATDAQRMLTHFSVYPKSGTRLGGDSTTYATFTGSNGLALKVVLVPTTWGYVTYSTNLAGGPLYVVRMPIEGEPADLRTNIASGLVDAINNYATNRIAVTATNLVASNANVKILLLSGGGLFGLEKGTNVYLGMTPTSIVVNATGPTNLALSSNATVKPLVLGAGGGVFAAEQGTNAVLHTTPTSVVFSAVGDINTATNMGTSNATVKPVLLDKVGAALRFFNLQIGTNIVGYMTATSIVINADLGAFDSLPELQDVADAFASLANGDVLTYHAASGKWTNAVPPGAAGGEANTGSNLGTGWPTYDSKDTVDLRFNTWTNGWGLLSSSNGNTFTMRLDTAIKVDNILATNAIGRLRSLVTSTATTNQIDIASGPQAYYWTNMVTNIVLQVTNVWTAGVTNRSIDFFFTGATNNGPTYTVTFDCPNPAGVNFRWGWNSATNGATSFSVTNSQRAAATLTMWETNVGEAFFSIVR